MSVIPLNDLQWSQSAITTHSPSCVGKLKAIRDIIDNDASSKFETVDFCIEGETKHNGGANNASGEGTLIIGGKAASAIPGQRFVFGGAASASSMTNYGCPPHNESTASQINDQVFGGYAPDGFGNDAGAIRPSAGNLQTGDDNRWYTQDPSGNSSKPWTKYGLVTSQPGDQTWIIQSEDILCIAHRKIAANTCHMWVAGRILEAADTESGWFEWDAGLPGMFAGGGEANSASYWTPVNFWDLGYNSNGGFTNGSNSNNELKKALFMVLSPQDGSILERVRRIHNTTSLDQNGLGYLSTPSGKQVYLPVHYARNAGYYQYLGKLRNMGYANDAICRQQLHDDNDYLQVIYFSRSITAAADAIAFVNPIP